MAVSRKEMNGGRGGGGRSPTRAHVTGVKLISSLELSPPSPLSNQFSTSPVNSVNTGRNCYLRLRSAKITLFQNPSTIYPSTIYPSTIYRHTIIRAQYIGIK